MHSTCNVHGRRLRRRLRQCRESLRDGKTVTGVSAILPPADKSALFPPPRVVFFFCRSEEALVPQAHYFECIWRCFPVDRSAATNHRRSKQDGIRSPGVCFHPSPDSLPTFFPRIQDFFLHLHPPSPTLRAACSPRQSRLRLRPFPASHFSRFFRLHISHQLIT